MSKPIQASLKRYLNVGLLRIIGKKKLSQINTSVQIVENNYMYRFVFKGDTFRDDWYG